LEEYNQYVKLGGQIGQQQVFQRASISRFRPTEIFLKNIDPFPMIITPNLAQPTTNLCSPDDLKSRYRLPDSIELMTKCSTGAATPEIND